MSCVYTVWCSERYRLFVCVFVFVFWCSNCQVQAHVQSSFKTFHITQDFRGGESNQRSYTPGVHKSRSSVRVHVVTVAPNICSIIITVSLPLHTKTRISLHAASSKGWITVMCRSLQDCGTSVWNLVLVTHLEPNIWRRRQYFWEICASLIRTLQVWELSLFNYVYCLIMCTV